MKLLRGIAFRNAMTLYRRF